MFRYVFSLLMCAAPLSAQYGPVQDSTLIGLRRVALNVTSTLKGPNTYREDIALELRKAGIRVATTGLDSVDGVMNVLLRAPRNECDALVRIDVEQRARMVRTGATYRVVTWFYEDDGGGQVCGGPWFKDASRRAVDAFLTKWLDMNGR